MNYIKNVIMLFFAVILLSCQIDTDSGSPESSSEKNTSPVFEIKDFYATGKNKSVQLSWAPVSDKYDVFILDGTSETNEKYYVQQSCSEIKVEAKTKSYCFSELENSTVEKRILKNSKKGNTPVYTYTLIVKDKNGTEVDRKTAQATPAQTDFSYSENNGIVSTVGNVWLILLDADSYVPQMATVEGYTKMKGYSEIKTTSVAAIEKCSGYNQYPYIFNNPEAVTKLVQDTGKLQEANKIFEKFLLEGETIEWFTLIPAGAHGELYGKVVKTAVTNSEYTEIEGELVLNSALELKAYDKSLRIGTKVRTKGYYQENDGGAALYVIANRSTWTYGSIETKLHQSCNIICENNYLNLRALGAGHCTQITKANYAEWEAYETAKYFYNGENLSEYRENHTGWEKFDHNDDAARWTEAKKILDQTRTDKNQTITLYVPAGNYRCASGISMDVDNFVFKGETKRRDIQPSEQETFEANYAPGNEGGSSLSGNPGTYFYTDNGSHFWWYHGFGSGVYGATNVTMEGITIEARETDSKRTFWHNTEDKAPYFTGVTYRADSSKTNEPTQADQLWYSRQFQISQSSNVTVKNCEFIITNHVRDDCVYEESGSEWLDPSAKTSEKRAANQWVETTDLHTDKQFTTVTLYADWHDVTIDDCLIYNNAGVYRGSAIGFLDFYCGGCSNGTLSNSTLFCNIHDEMIGVFTKSTDFMPERKDRGIKNVQIKHNKIYPTRDEHVDYIKPRIMVFTVGYDVSPNICDVYIQDNYIWTDNLSSKLFTFGGFDSVGRGETIISGNNIVIENSGGSYLFETRPNATIARNNITLKSSTGSISQLGMFMVQGSDKRDLYVTDNNIDIQCNYNGFGIFIPNGQKPGGIYNGNKIHVAGNLNTPVFKTSREIRNNTITVDGDCNSIISYESANIDSPIVIDGNTFIYNKDDHNDDYSWGNPVPEGSRYKSGQKGPTFLNYRNQSSDYTITVSNNTIKAPNATLQNKHFIRNYNSKVKTFVTGNNLSKFKYLRGVSERNSEYFVYINNFIFGNTLATPELCFFDDTNNDTEPGKYEYISDGSYYKLINWNGQQEFPDYYDDGDHGYHQVQVIGESSCTGDTNGHNGGTKKIPSTTRIIEDYAFKESYSKGVKLPAGLESIGKEAFYNSKTGTNEWVKIHNITIKGYYIDIPSSVTKIGSGAFGHTDDTYLLIRCEAKEKPEGWADDWYYGKNIDVLWEFKNENK